MPEVSNGSRCDTAPKQRIATGRPFTKGDPRINRKGRPRSFDEARALAQEIVHRATLADGSRTLIEKIFSDWAKDPKHQRDLVEYAFGKVPDKLETTGLENKPVLILHVGRNGKVEDKSAN